MNDKLRPLSPWEYFGYSILFNIPFIGFILLIVFSIDDSNINRRNYARSFWCIYVLVLIILVILLLIGVTIPIIPSSTNTNMFPKA